MLALHSHDSRYSYAGNVGSYDSAGWRAPIPGVPEPPGGWDRPTEPPGSQGLKAADSYDTEWAPGQATLARFPKIIVNHEDKSQQVEPDWGQVSIGDTAGSSDRLAVHAIPGVTPSPRWTATGAPGSEPTLGFGG
jgi:hypothetical protein